LSQQEHIKEALEAADKGLLNRDSIKRTIKADFDNQNTGRISVLDIRNKLARKYGYSLRAIYLITNS